MVVAVAATTSRAAVAPAESDELWWSGGEKNLHFLSRKVNIDKEIGDPFSEASDCRYNGQEKLHNMARRKRANDTQNNALIETGSHHHYHEHHLNHYQYQYQYQYHFHTVEHAGSNNSNSYSNSSSNSNKNNHKRQITTRRSIPKTVQNRMYQITSQQFKNGQHSRKARHRNHLHHQQQQQLIQYILNLLKTILVLILIAQTRLSFDGGGFTGRGYGKAITGVSCTSVLTRSTGQTSGDSSERGVVVVVDQSGQHDGQHSSSQLLVDGDKFDLYSSRPAAKGWLPVFSVTDDDDDEVTSDHRHQLNKRRQRKRSSEDQNDHDGQVRVVTSLPSILGKLGRLKRDRFNGSDNDSDDGGHNAASDTINTLTETNSTLSMDGNDQQQAMQANNSQADHNRQVATSGNSSTGPLSTTSSLHQERSIMGPAAPAYKWPVLGLVGLMFIGATGNILVCMAVLRERRLQTATNYFLLSLAVADLLVCTLVMPFGIIYEFYGRWPYDWRICNLWVTCDVLTCSSSILHMCFISVGRYLGIRNPLHARQANLFVSRRAVLWRIAIAWASSALIASPITMMSLYDHKNIVPSPTECAISNKYFMIFGSLLAFFIPMFVMVPSYVMTVKLLSRRAKFVRNDSILLANQQSQAAASSAAGLLANGGGGAGGGASILDDPTTAASYADTTTGLYDTGGSISSAARFAESARQRRRATAAAAANAARQCRIRSSMDELASSSSLKGGAAGTGRAGAGAATGHQLLAPPKTRRSQRRDFWSGLISESGSCRESAEAGAKSASSPAPALLSSNAAHYRKPEAGGRRIGDNNDEDNETSQASSPETPLMITNETLDMCRFIDDEPEEEPVGGGGDPLGSALSGSAGDNGKGIEMVEEEGADQDQEEDQDEDDCSTRTIVKLEDAAGCQLERGAREASSRPEVGNDAVLGQFPLANQAKTCSAMLSSAGQPVQEEGAGCSGGSEQHGQAAIDLSSTTMATASAVLFVSTLSATKCQRTTCHHHHHRSRRQTTRWLSCCRSRGAQCCSAYLTAATSSQQLTQSSALAPVTGTGAPGGRSNLAAQLAAVKDEDAELDKKQSTLATTTITGWPARLVPNREDKPNRNEQQLEQQQQVSSNKVGTLAANWAEHLFPPTPRQALCLDCQRGADDGAASASSMVSHSSCWNCGRQCCWPTSWWPQTDDTVTPATSALLRPTTPGQQFHKVALEMAGTTDLVTTSTTSSGQHNSDTTRLQQQLNVVQVQSPGFVAAAALTTKGKQANGCIQADQNYFLLVSERRRLAQLNQRAANNNNDNHKLNNNNNHTDYRRPTTRPDQVCICLEATVTSGGGDPLATSSFGSARPAAPAAAQGLRQQHNCQDKRQSSLSPAPLEDTPQLGETRARDKEDNSESGTDNGIAATGRGARPPAPSNKSEPNERSNSSNNNSNNNKPSEVSSKSRQPAIASIASDFSGSGLLALGGSAPKSLLCFQPNRHWSQQQHAILSQHEQLSSAVAAEAAIDDGDKLVRSLGETGAANGTRRGPVLGGASSCGEPNRNRYDCQDHDDGQKEDNDDEVLLADPKLGSRARDSGRPSLGCAERDDHMSLGQEAGAVSIQSRARQNNEQQRYKQHQELAGRKGTEIQEHELRIISFISHETNGGGMGSRSNDNNNNDKTENNNGELAASSVRHDLRFAAKRSRVLCSNCALTLASLQRQRHHNQHYNNSSSHELVKGCAMTQSWRPLVTTGRGAPASEEDQSQQRTTELGLQRLRRNDHDEQNHQLNLSTTRQCTSTTATSTTTSTSTTTTSAYSNNNGTTNNERIAPASLAGPNGLDNQSSGWDGHVRFSCMATSSTSSYSATATSCGTSETHNRMEAEAAIACGARRLDAADDDDGGIDLGAPVAILEGNQQAEDGPVKSNLWSEHHEPGAKLALASGDAGGDPLAGCTIVCTICQSEFVRSSRRNRRRQLKHKHHHQHHHHHHNHHHHHDQHNHHHHHHQRSQHHHPHHHHHHHHQHRTHHHHHQPQQQHLQQQHNHNYHHHQHSHNHNHSHHHHHHHHNHGPCLQQHNNSTVSFRNKRSSSLKHRNNNQQAQRSPLDHHKLFELKSILMSNHRHHVQLKTTRTTTRSPTVLNSTKGNRCGCDGTIPYTVPVYAIEAVTGFGPGSERLPAPPSSSVVVVVERRNGSHINMHTTECCNPTGGDSVRFVNQSNEQKQSSENYDDNSTTQSSRSMPTTTTNATTTAASSIVTIKLNSIERNDDDPGPARLALIAPQCDQSCAKSSPGGEPQTLTRTTILAHDKSCVNAADNNNDNTENNHNKSDESQSLASTKQALVVADSNSPPHRGVQSSSSHTEQTGQLACQEPTSGQVVVSGCSSPPPPPPTEAADDSQRRRATSSNLLVSRINANSSSTKSTSGSSLTTADTNHHQHETGGGGIGGGVVDTRGSNAHSMNARDTASAGANNYNNNPPDDTQMIRYLGSSNQVRSEQKATKVLGVVFFTFVICWSPFFIINFIQGFVGRDQLSKWISDEMLTTFLWLGYISSTINPVIYTVFNRNFRRAFRRLLLCREPVGRRPYRQSRSSDYYKSFRFSVNQHHNHHRHHHHQANQFVGGGGGANNFKLANNNNISGNRLRSGGHQGNNIRSGDGKRSRSGGSSSHKMLMLDESRALTGGFSNREMDATSMGGVTSQQQQHQQQQARSPSKSSLNVTATHLRQSFGLALRTALRNSTKLILPTSTSSSAANSTRSACEQNQDQDYHHHRQQQQQQQPSMMLSRCSTSVVNVD